MLAAGRFVVQRCYSAAPGACHPGRRSAAAGAWRRCRELFRLSPSARSSILASCSDDRRGRRGGKSHGTCGSLDDPRRRGELCADRPLDAGHRRADPHRGGHVAFEREQRRDGAIALDDPPLRLELADLYAETDIAA